MTTTAASPSRRLSELMLDYLAYLELERGLSRNTLEAYRSDLQQYGAFLDRTGLDPLAATTADLRAFVSEVQSAKGSGAAPATVQRKVACLRSFYRHLRREQILEQDPTAELRGPRLGARLPTVLSRDEVQALLRQPRRAAPV